MQRSDGWGRSSSQARNSPQYVKLARILRDKIKAGDLGHRAALAASGLTTEYAVSVRAACAAPEMLEANRYVTRRKRFQCYHVTWQAGQ